MGRKHRRWSKAAPRSPAALAAGECHLAQWRLHAPNASDLLQAIDLQIEYQLSFWDAQVVQSAASLGCKQILSEDLNHGQVYGDVQVINPFKELD